MENTKKGLNSNQLKVIAIIAMTIDHLTWAFFPGCNDLWYVYCLHIIGRLTAPIMWFFIAEGSFYTRNPKKYIGRLFMFAVISHFAYDFAFGIPFLPLSTGVLNQTSVMWSLALSATLIALLKDKKFPLWAEVLMIAVACILGLPSDWSTVAVIIPVFMYNHRGDFKKQALDIVIWTFSYSLVYFLVFDKPYGVLQMFTALAIPFLAQYNGERGKAKGMKWLFYIYYPAHLVVVGIIRLLLHGNVPLFN